VISGKYNMECYNPPLERNLIAIFTKGRGAQEMMKDALTMEKRCYQDS
jgi:hypothetical protein